MTLILTTYTDEAMPGIAVVLTTYASRFGVSLCDTDADQTVGTTVYPTLERAVEAAETLVIGQPAPMFPHSHLSVRAW